MKIDVWSSSGDRYVRCMYGVPSPGMEYGVSRVVEVKHLRRDVASKPSLEQRTTYLSRIAN